jgi:mono/diheme cytochrome c family protein
MLRLILLASAALATSTIAAEVDVSKLPPPAARAVDFAQDIRPILETSCVKCHGPEKQKSGFRVDVKDLALKGGDNYAPNIHPGKSAESPLIHFVAGLDPDMLMPSKGNPLTTEQIGLLRAWIDQGAVWPDDGANDLRKTHWSFQPVQRPLVPEIRNPKSEVRNPIDAFIGAKLVEKGLTLSPEADPRIFIRRIYFDLLGLPPAPEEVEAFVRAYNSPSTDHDSLIAATVDTLLASPHYGERWARHWLDVVRFAESDGFETNQPRPNAWRYRDYVIRAFNDDKPYDQFIREQLAGDALGLDEATGFIVGGPADRVKSPDPVLTAQQRADELHDMVGTTGSAFLGLTVNCARCHNHKFDPISQADYYSMVACFAGVQHGERPLRTTEDEVRKHEADALRPRLAEIEAALESVAPIAEPGATATRRAMVSARRNVERIAPAMAKQVRFTIAETNNGSEPCIDELEVWTEDGHNIALAAKGTSSGNYAGEPKHQLPHINDGQYGNGRSWISNTAGRGWVQLDLPRPEKIVRLVWGRDREEKYKDRLPTRYTIEVSEDGAAWRTVANSSDRAPFKTDVPPPADWDTPELTAEQRAEAVKLDSERRAIEAKIAALTGPALAYAGRFEQPQATRRLHRGDPMQPKEIVTPAALESFGTKLALATDAPEQQRRLALANWIADPRHPLTARVLVNRLWHYHFGIGLVDTPSDFGLNGARPSHPELLDWLASEFIARGWSVKQIQRLILTSATYRQSGAPNPQAAAIDASDRLLWRFPPRRLEAEPLRDTILAVSGTLDLRMGGPGFDLFEPNTNYVKVYTTKTKFVPGDFRRMIYQNKPRVELDNLFGAFDCPDAGQIQPKRNVSTTPLQALNLLNSEFIVGQARSLAERLQRDAGPDCAAQVRRAFQLVFAREPSADELSASSQLIAGQGVPIFCRALYNANEFVTVY